VLLLYIEVRSAGESGEVRYLNVEVPFRPYHKRRGVSHVPPSELETPRGVRFAVGAEHEPGTGRGKIELTVSGKPFIRVSSLTDYTWLEVVLPSGEELQIVAKPCRASQ
jgi:hypothetical protein